ncbi:MAG: YihY/virulence factor BrkB family protein, partial [Clostridia bacterium]|nr:YihY/virulence factor BrkB family protein [Clostridia bacterium]
MRKKIEWIIRAVRIFSKETAKENIRTHASSSAFFTFLSLIPFLLLLISAIPYTPLTKADLLSAIVFLLPNSIDGYAIHILDQLYHNSLTVLSASVITAIWSSAQGFLSITNGLNAIYHVKENRNYFLLRIRAACYTVIFMILLLVSVMLACF